MSARHVVWIGAAGTVTGHGVARRIRAAWGTGVSIVAADINPPTLVAAFELADACEQIPLLADREAFVSALAAGFSRHGVDTYVPLLVDEIAIAADLSAAGALGSVGVLAPPPGIARLCTDKLALAEHLEAAGIPVPPTVSAAEAVWWPNGIVVKDRGGEGSRGVERLGDPADLERARTRGDTAVAQRRCDAPEVTIDAFRGRERDVWEAVCRERLEVKAGVCTKARLFRDRELEGIVRRVAEALELHGALCVQVMRGPAGWEVTDVNPRSGGATAMSAAVGVDTIAAGLADLWGEDPSPYLESFAGQAHVVRSYQESVRPLPAVLALDLDGTLLSCEHRQVAVAREVMGGLDAARFWADKQSGATTAAALSAQGCTDEDAAARWVAQIEREDWLALDRPLPGAAEAVSEARRRGLRVVVLTARRDPEAVRRQVAAHRLADPADVLVVDPADAAIEKARILRALGAVGFVGDTESDARAAELASVPFACVAGGQRSASFLRDQGLEPLPGGALAGVRSLLDPPGASAGRREERAAAEQREGYTRLVQFDAGSERDRLKSIAADSWYALGANGASVRYCSRVFARHWRGHSCLELGPAEGEMTQTLAPRFERLVLVDGSQQFCDALAARHAHAEVTCSLFEEWDTDERFDTIVIGHVLEHVDDPRSLLARARGWLAPEGVLLAAVPNARSIHRQAAVLLGLLKEEHELNETDHHHGHRRVYDPESLRADVLGAGLTLDHFGGYWLKPLSNAQLDQNWLPEMLDAFMALGERYPDVAAEMYVVATA